MEKLGEQLLAEESTPAPGGTLSTKTKTKSNRRGRTSWYEKLINADQVETHAVNRAQPEDRVTSDAFPAREGTTQKGESKGGGGKSSKRREQNKSTIRIARRVGKATETGTV